MDEKKNSPNPGGPKKKSRGSRTLTIIFYTLYCILIVFFLAGLYFANGRLEETLAQYEQSHITVQAEAAFQTLFSDPDWQALYAMAGIEDTGFEDAQAYVSYMEANVDTGVLAYRAVPGSGSSLDYLLLHDGQTIGSFRMTDMREPGARWPNWQPDGITLEIPRSITVKIRKLDSHTVTVNGVALDERYTQRIDTLLAEEYALPGTSGIAMELQQVDGLLVTPEIAIFDEEGNPCPVTLDPETGIYEEQLPEALPLTAQQESIALAAANAWGAYKLRNASEGNLSLSFDPREGAYRSIVSSPFWVQEPVGYTVTSVEILASQVYSDTHFSAYIAYTVQPSGSDTRISKSATLFFDGHKGSWICYELQPGSVYTDVTKVKLEFRVDGTAVYYDFYETDRTAFYVPLVTAPQGYFFAGWGVEAADGTLQTVFTPDETGFVTLSPSTVPEPMVLHAIFEPTEGGN